MPVNQWETSLPIPIRTVRGIRGTVLVGFCGLPFPGVRFSPELSEFVASYDRSVGYELVR
jgi:hypothetical protein